MGQLLVNEALPEEYRNYDRVLDKKGMHALLREIAEKSPEKYREVSKKLADVGRHVATRFGGNSFSLEHMLKAKSAHTIGNKLQADLDKILNDDDLTDQQRHELIIRKTGAAQEQQMKEVYAESLAENNPLAKQVQSGSRGNEMNLASLRGSDMLYTDHHDNVIPLPVIRSYSQGLTPAEYWAGTYGARKGVMATKFATQDAGFLSKQLNQVSHRLMVSDLDHENEYPSNRGLPVDVDDMDSEGALLAQDVGPYKRHTMLTPKILKHIKSLGNDKILVRSALVGGSPDGGVYSRDVGVRERGGLPGRGEQIGLQAAQALSEPLQQGQLSAKHSGGVAGQEKAVSGFDAVNQLIQAPKTFKGGAAHSNIDGTVQRIEDAPAGGKFITIDGQQHYVGRGYDPKVRPGDQVEAGDMLSDGWPNPATVIEHKGIGEGRRYFMGAMRDAMRGAGLKVNRRNLEVLSRGLINHVRLTEEHGDHVPDDVVPYSTLEHTYEPREGHESVHPKKALGKYLERPILHHTIGTKVRPSMLKELEHFGVDNITVHHEPPPFQAEMIRGMANVAHDPDWMTRMYGSGQKASLLDAAQRGGTSNELGTSFVPGLSRAVDFGRIGMVRQPEPTSKPDLAGPSVPATKPPTAPAPPAPPKKSWAGLMKWSEDRKLRLKEANDPATPKASPSPTTASPPPPPAPQVSAPAATGAPATPSMPAAPASPKPSYDYIGGIGTATTANIQQKAQQQNPGVYNGGFQRGQNYLHHMDPGHAQQFMEEGGIGAIGHGLDQNAWGVLTGQVQGHNMQPRFPGRMGRRVGMGGFPGMDDDFDGEGGGEEHYHGGGAHPGGGVMPNPGGGPQPSSFSWNSLVPQSGHGAALTTSVGAYAGGMGLRALGTMGSEGNWLNRTGKLLTGTKAVAAAPGVPAVAAKAGLSGLAARFVTPLMIGKETGEDIGNAISDVREGKFFSTDGRINQQNAAIVDKYKDLAKPADPNASNLDNAGNAAGHLLEFVNPVHNARLIGAGSVELARTSGAALNEQADARQHATSTDAAEVAALRQRIANPTVPAERKQEAQQRLQQVEAEHGPSFADKALTFFRPNAVTGDQQFQQQAYTKQQELKKQDAVRVRNELIAAARPPAEAIIVKLRQGVALSPEEYRLLKDSERGYSTTGPLIQPVDAETAPYGAFGKMLHGQYKDDAAVHAAVAKEHQRHAPPPVQYTESEKAQQEMYSWKARTRELAGDALLAQLRKERDALIASAPKYKDDPDAMWAIEQNIRDMGANITGSRYGVGGGKYKYNTPDDVRDMYESGKWQQDALWKEFEDARKGIQPAMQKGGSALPVVPGYRPPASLGGGLVNPTGNHLVCKNDLSL